MTEREAIGWINLNLGPVFRQALADRPVVYTDDWLGGLVYREVGILIHRYAPSGMSLAEMAPLMKGDYGKRPADPVARYHGYSFFQIDIASFPLFIASGDWKDPLASCRFAISVLEGKRRYLRDNFKNLKGEAMDRAVTAAYNCGEGNVAKVLRAGQDIDTRTHARDYSKMVWQYRAVYRGLP